MSVHLMPGPQAGAGPPGKATGPPGQAAAPTTTGPPGSAALFAALLLRSGSPAPPITAAQITVSPITGLPVTTEPTKNETEKNTSNPSGPRRDAKSRQTTPLNADAATAQTQNAMDTPPVSFSSPGESANRKPDGELPLSEPRTPASVGSAALPPLLPTASIAASPIQIVPVSIAPVSIAPVPASLVSESPVANAPVIRSTSPLVNAAPMAVPAARADAPKPTTALPLPKTFAILPRQAIGRAYTAETNAPDSPASVQPLSPPFIAAGRYDEIGSAVVTSQPAIASMPVIGKMPQKTQAAVIASAVSAPPALEQAAPAPEPGITARLPQETSPLPQAAATGAVRNEAPSVKIEAARAGESLVPAPSLSAKSEQPPASSPVLPAEVAAPQEAASQPVIALLTTARSPQILGAVETIRDAPTAAPTEKPLKAGAVSADTQTINNTRVSPASARSPFPLQPPAAVAARQEEKAPERDEKTPESDARALVPTSAPAASAAPDKPAALPPLSHAERAQIVKQAAEGVGAMRPPTRPETPQQMTIQLHPKDWGKLQVSVTLAPSSQREAAPGQKAVTAHVVAETPQIKAALESQSGALRHALQSSGMHLDRLTVSVQSASHIQSASASGGSQPQTNLGGGNGNGQPGASPFASFAGNSQGGRQEQSSNYPAAFNALEPEDSAEPLPLRPMMRGQIDTRA